MSSSSSISGFGWVGGIIFKFLIPAQDGQNRRIVSADFGEFEIAEIWIRMRIAEAAALEDRDRDAP